MKILHEIAKQNKLIFRSWSSLSLLVLAPLILILLLGYAFSSNSLHGITIGIYSSEGTLQPELLQNISGSATLVRYTDIPSCQEALKQGKLQLCIDLEGKFFSGQVSTSDQPGKVVFYYDNSNRGVAEQLITKIREFFGIQTEHFSISTTETIFDSVSKLVVFLAERNNDLRNLTLQSVSLRTTLVTRGERLQEVYDEYLPHYTRVKESYAVFTNASQKYFSSAEKLNESILTIREEVTTVRDLLNQAILLSGQGAGQNGSAVFYITSRNATVSISSKISPNSIYNISDEYILVRLNSTQYAQLTNLTNGTNATPLFNLITYATNTTINSTHFIFTIPSNHKRISIPLSMVGTAKLSLFERALTDQLAILDGQVQNLQDNLGAVNSQVQEVVTAVSTTVAELDTIKTVLEDEIQFNKEAIIDLDRSVIKIQEISTNLNTSLSGLSQINPDLAKKIIRPFEELFTVLLPNAKNIQLMFPLLLVAIIIFSSILFSTVVTFSEIHSMASFRNKITPVGSYVWFFGLFVTNILVVLFQVAILFIVAQVQFELPILEHLLPLTLIALVLIIIFVLLGMGIAILIENRQTSVLVATFLALTFFLFGNAIAPLETMPVTASTVANLNPFVIGNTITREVLLLGVPLQFLITDLLLLIGYAFGLLIITYLLFFWKRNT
jgi:ABC-type multidrug transport system permease subunit